MVVVLSCVSLCWCFSLVVRFVVCSVVFVLFQDVVVVVVFCVRSLVVIFDIEVFNCRMFLICCWWVL